MKRIFVMKRSLLFLLFCAVIALSSATLLGGCNQAQPLHVNEVSADPAAYTGTITVTGVTKGFSRTDPAVFGLVDIKEMQCTSPTCSMPILPVHFQGKLPAVGDEVRVTGSFVQMQGGYLFSANDIKVVRHHQIGG
jgi:hypothetical protein